MNALALEAKRPRKSPVAVIAGIVAANPDKYVGGDSTGRRPLTRMPLPMYIGMPLNLTRHGICILCERDGRHGVEGQDCNGRLACPTGDWQTLGALRGRTQTMTTYV